MTWKQIFKKLTNRKEMIITDSNSLLDFKQKIITIRQLALDRKMEKLLKMLETQLSNEERNFLKFLLVEANQEVLKKTLFDFKGEVNSLTREIRSLIEDTRR